MARSSVPSVDAGTSTSRAAGPCSAGCTGEGSASLTRHHPWPELSLDPRNPWGSDVDFGMIMPGGAEARRSRWSVQLFQDGYSGRCVGGVGVRQRLVGRARCGSTVAAMLARGEPPPGPLRQDSADRRSDWPDDLCEIVYIDHFGNGMTGLRAAMLARDGRLAAAGRVLERARTFSDLPPGGAF